MNNIPSQRQTLLKSIAATISDYRSEEIELITPSHVNKWVNQFDSIDQLTILTEMNAILKRRYFSKSRIQYILQRALTSKIIFGDHPQQVIPNLKFLNIQKKGNSQKNLLKLANEITKREYRVNIDNFGKTPQGYIYLDDCIFSGNTVYWDLQDWWSEAVKGKTLYLIFLAVHTDGLRYLKQRLDQKAQEKNITIDYRPCYEFHNIYWQDEKFECLWPREINNHELIDNILNSIANRCQANDWNPRIFRPNGTPKSETLFSSEQARDIVEKAFLKAGSYIVSLPDSPKPEMRPMGYEKLESLGFGSMFITYRNIANNCPLALWWGDTNFPKNHPFSKWYPLFPRKVNEKL